ncbi:lipocalin family protein [Falsiroseomonas sp. E2-1-a20]|uniref:lipocalin family protein n=1 Tax=Falsiroseomonas sp. E2-1-a20 TaxID=3239300 RepID=UPI003F3F1E72
MTRLLALALLLVVSACSTAPTAPPPATVAQVDLARYAGTWFEIARFPNSFQDAPGQVCIATTATYAARPDGQIAVTNRCEDAAGRPNIATGSAYAVAGTGNAKLRVSFFWPFYGDYWVLGLDPDYRWALVGAPNRDYLWILSRTRTMTEADTAAATAIAAREGFDITRLRRTPQPSSNVATP